jgi:hypothetical protein
MRSPTSPFANAARIIANGKPQPEWLIPALEHFNKKRTWDDYLRWVKETNRMHDAVELVLKGLHGRSYGSGGDFDRGNDMEITFDVLTAFKEDLSTSTALANRRGGPKPNLPRWVCAAVVVEAWEEIHGDGALKGDPFYEACNEYWIACGGEYRGEDYTENWRRDVERGISIGMGKYVAKQAFEKLLSKVARTGSV